MSVITANTGSNNWNTGAAWVGGVQPTQTDDVIIPATAVVTIPSSTTVQCIGLTVQASGTVAWAATTSILNIGDASTSTAATANVALSVSATATITLTGVGQMNFVGTCTTQQTINSGGKTMPTSTISGIAGTWTLSGNSWTTTGGWALSNGTFATANLNMQASNTYSLSGSAARTWTPGSSTITVTATTGATNFIGTTTTNLTVSANTATLRFSASTTGGANFGGFNWNGMSFTMDSAAQSTPTLVFNGATLGNFTWAGPATKTSTPVFTGNLTLTGAWSWTGSSALNRSLLAPSLTVLGTAITITAATNTNTSNVDFRDITFAGAASWSGTSTGDTGGNSGFTFTTPATQTNTGATGNWSDSTKWTSRVPLPQDDVTINTGSGTITADMPRLGKSITFTSGFSGTANFTLASGMTIYGSITLVSGITFSATQNVTFEGRGTHTITSAGKSFGGAQNIQAFGGSYTLQDAFTQSNLGNFTVTYGTFDTGSFSFSVPVFVSTGTTTRAVTLGTSTVSLTTASTTTIWSISGSGLTLSAASSTIVIVNTTTNTRTFTGGAFNYGTITYTVGGSTGQLTMNGAQYIRIFNFSDASNARTVTFIQNALCTIGNLNIFGTSGKLMTLKSAAGGTAAILDLTGAVTTTMDYLTIQDINSAIPGKFYAGVNSTSVSGNTNVNIAAAPSPGLYVDFIDTVASTGSSTTVTLPSYHVPTSGQLIHLNYGATGSPSTINNPSGYSTDVTVGNGRQWKKISDGTETGVTVTTSGSPASTTVTFVMLGGFTGTPTYDVSDTNNSGAATSLASGAASGPTNTGTPAIALAFFQGNGNLGAAVSATNSFEIGRNLSSTGHILAKSLSTTAAIITTYTWSTSRTPFDILAVYKDVAVTVTNTGGTMLLMGAG